VSFDCFSFSAFSVAILDSFNVPIEGWSILSGLTRRDTETAAWCIDRLYSEVCFDVVDISSSCSIADCRARKIGTFGIDAYYVVS
jgi:hypothetical protein